MLEGLAEKICNLLLKADNLNKSELEIYIYGIKVILLNAGITLCIFIISFLMGNLAYCISFFCFFVPLRVFAGGWHSKNSGICFIFSNLMYYLSLIIFVYAGNLFRHTVMIAAAVLSVIIIIIFAPITSKNHPLPKQKQLRNRFISVALILIDSTAFILLFRQNNSLAAVVQISVMLVAGLMIAAVIDNGIRNKS